MSLTDKLLRIYDKIFNFLLGGNSDTDLSDKVIERKERLIQTYIVVFGLLIAYDGDMALQKLLMYLFMSFLLFSISYYTLLSSSYASTNGFTINSLTWFIAFNFSLSLIVSMYKFYMLNTDFYSLILPSWLSSVWFVESYISFTSLIQSYILLPFSLLWFFALTIAIAFSLRI